jgi:hypothetical protein
MEAMGLEAIPSMQQTVTRELQAIREEAFSRAFNSLRQGNKRCGQVGRDE